MKKQTALIVIIVSLIVAVLIFGYAADKDITDYMPDREKLYELGQVEFSIFTFYNRKPLLKLPDKGRYPGMTYCEWTFDGEKFERKRVWIWTGEKWCKGK